MQGPFYGAFRVEALWIGPSLKKFSLHFNFYWQSILIMPDAFVFIICTSQLQYQRVCIYIIKMIYRTVQGKHNSAV